MIRVIDLVCIYVKKSRFNTMSEDDDIVMMTGNFTTCDCEYTISEFLPFSMLFGVFTYYTSVKMTVFT